jgi:hypothetical protein
MENYDRIMAEVGGSNPPISTIAPVLGQDVLNLPLHYPYLSIKTVCKNARKIHGKIHGKTDLINQHMLTKYMVFRCPPKAEGPDKGKAGNDK